MAFKQKGFPMHSIRSAFKQNIKDDSVEEKKLRGRDKYGIEKNIYKPEHPKASKSGYVKASILGYDMTVNPDATRTYVNTSGDIVTESIHKKKDE